jgi:EmrB/QacA subfamily drug resistance transporter
VLIAATLASALGFIDGSVISIAIPAIRADIGATLTQAQWVSNSYMLMLSALILAGGALGDRFGLRRSFAAGIAVFIGASLACAFAPTPEFLIVARGVQGLGAAVMVPGSLAIIAKAYPKAERGGAIGIWAASSALTTALGPVIGGLVLSIDESVWRWIFAINVPLGGVAIYMLLVQVPADPPASARRIDIAGALLAIAALGAFAVGLTFLSGELQMPVPYLSVMLIGAGIALTGVFVAWEWRHPEPMMDPALFRARTFSGANISTFFIYFALSAILFYLPMLVITAWGLAESAAGFVFLPLSALIALLSGPVGKLSDRIGPRLPMAAGSLVVAVSYAGLALLSENGVHAFWFGVLPLMVVMGLGMSLVVSPLSIAVMTSIDDEDTGAASGINNAVARIAGLVAVAALGSVIALRYGAVVDAAGAVGLPEFGQPVGSLSAEMEAARVLASDKAFAAIAWISAIFCVIGAAVAWVTAPGKPSKEGKKAGVSPGAAG